jgi:tetratricopeptide (TPR) repeat protein
MRSVLFFASLLLAWSWALAPDAHAQGGRADRRAREQARAHVQRATTHYNLGRFEQALTEYTAAYEAFAAPLLLFNIGQCHRNLGNHERAVFFLESFLREATEITPEQRQLADELLRESQTALRAQAPQQDPEPADPEPEPTEPEVEARVEASIGGAGLADRPPTPQVYEEGWFWAVILASAAVVGAVIGIGVWAVTQEPQLPSGTLGTVVWE